MNRDIFMYIDHSTKIHIWYKCFTIKANLSVCIESYLFATMTLFKISILQPLK